MVATRDGALVIPESRQRAAVYLAGGAPLGLGLASAVGMPWAVLVVAAYVVAVAAVLRRNGLGGEVRLDPRGVTFAMRAYPRRLEWDEVREVTATRPSRVAVAAPGGGAWVRTDRFDADRLTIYWTLRYYATHPESREELADDRAVERVRREALT